MIGLGPDKNPKPEGSITASHIPKLESWTYLNWSEILRSNTLLHGFLVRGSALLHFPPGCGKAVTHSFMSNWKPRRPNASHMQVYSRKVRKGSLSSTMMDLQPSSLNQTTNLAECAVCHQVLSERYESSVQIGKRSYIFVDTEKHWKSVFLQPIPKGRVHYGGVSCYSCRAFFR